MELFLFTNFFPFKRSEPFLVNEFSFASDFCRKITILSLYGKAEDNSLPSSGSTHVAGAVFHDANQKSGIFLKGIFNTAPFHFHIRELFSRNLFFSPGKLYWWAVSLCITRAALASQPLKTMIKEIEASPAPVLYFYWGDNLTWLIPYLAKKLKHKNIKIVVRLHGSDLYENLKADYAPLRKQIFSNAERLFTVSTFGQQYLISRYPEFSEKITVARLGIRDHGVMLEKQDNVFRVLSVSNLVALKRVHLIFEALQLLDVEAEWHHYGDGPLAAELSERIRSARSDLRVIFHGQVKNAALIKDLSEQYFDLFLNVSTSEGLPVSIMEAFSFGIPAIATNVGGTSDLVDDATGKLVDPDVTAQQLAVEIKRFYSHDLSGKRIAARKRFSELVNAEKNYPDFYAGLQKLSQP